MPEPRDALARDVDIVNHKLDTNERVFFYEQEFYVLSNFSAFQVELDVTFATAEHAYQAQKFARQGPVWKRIYLASSAHEAFKIAESERAERRSNWDDVKLDTMRHVLRKKHEQHEYVARKLQETGARELVEDSWRDDFWGIGPNGDGQNWLGKLWMEIREGGR